MSKSVVGRITYIGPSAGLPDIKKHESDFWVSAKKYAEVLAEVTALEDDLYRLAEWDSATNFYNSFINGYRDYGEPWEQADKNCQSFYRWFVAEEARIFGTKE